MSAVSLPVNRPSGRALLVASPATREQSRVSLEGLGFACVDADDPYAAAAALSRHSHQYRAVVVSLSSLYKEELTLVSMVRRRFPHVEIWLTHTDGRQAALAEAMRLGADGLLADDGLHRLGLAPDPSANPQPLAPPPTSSSRDDFDRDDSEFGPGDPVLTADELRALLQEQPMLPPGSDE